MERLQNKTAEQTVNAAGFGVIRFWRQNNWGQKGDDSAQLLIIGFCAADRNEDLRISFSGVEQGSSIATQTRKAEHLNAYRIFGEETGLDVRSLTDAQAVEALARFSIDWEDLRSREER